MTEPRRFKQVSCSACGQRFAEADSGYSHCRDHAAAVTLTAAQVGAMDETMTADDHISRVENLLARPRAPGLTRGQIIIKMMTMPGGSHLNLTELLAIIATVRQMIVETNDSMPQFSFEKAGDLIDDAYLALTENYDAVITHHEQRELIL